MRSIVSPPWIFPKLDHNFISKASKAQISKSDLRPFDASLDDHKALPLSQNISRAALIL
jgi:hypothetical protein